MRFDTHVTHTVSTFSGASLCLCVPLLNVWNTRKEVSVTAHVKADRKYQ